MNKSKHITLLILRLALGGMMTFAGAMKFFSMTATIGYFASMGLSPAITWIVAIGETLAGLGILFGVYTQLASAASAIIMAGAVYYTGGTMASPIVFLVLSLVLTYTGSGKFAIKPCACSIKDLAPDSIVNSAPTSSPTNPTV